jgi:hypothetical protein
MPRTKSFLKGGALLFCLGLLGFAGKKVGQQLARSGIVARSAAPSKVAKADEAHGEIRKQEAAREGLAARTFKRLSALIKESPNLRMDFEAQGQMDDLIAKLNGAELMELYKMVDQRQENFQMLTPKLDSALMAKDPDAAFQWLLQRAPGSENWQLGRAFATWAQDHAEAAFAWLNSAEMSEAPANLREDLRVMAMSGLIERDFERTTAEYLKWQRPAGEDYGRLSPMDNWGRMYADDPLMRERLLEFAKATGDPKDHAELNHSLLKGWPQEDAVGMMNYLYELKDYQESGAIPADKRLETDGTAVAAAIYREYDQAALMWWMQQHSDSRETPGPMREAMAAWLNKYPGKVRAWYDEQPPSVQRDALVSSFIPTLIQQKKFAEAAQWIDGMQDAEIRQGASERLGLLWSEQDATAAAAWKASIEGGVGK